SVGMVVSSNKVSATTRAYVTPAALQSVLVNVVAGGAVHVRAENSATITADTAMYGEVSPTNDAAAGIINNFAGLLMDQYDYTSRSGTKTLVFGDTVRVADDYVFIGTQANPGLDPAGAVFEWMGLDNTVIPLGSQDFTDFELWKQLTPTNLITDSFSYALLSEIGTALKKEGLTGGAKSYYGLVDYNDVRSVVEAYLHRVNVTAVSVSVQAFGLGSITASDVSVIVPWEGFGAVIVTNTVLADADAHIADSHLTTTGLPVSAADTLGDVVVEAQNAAAIDATARSHIEAWTAISAVVAFNSIGWKSSNLLFDAVDALLGDPLISSAFSGEQPADALAYLRNTTVVASGDITVTAVSAAQLNAVAGNENVVEAALDLLFTGAQTTTTTTNPKTGKSSSKTSGYGASGIAGGAILASNKVSSRADAFIEFTAAQGAINAAGAVTVEAEDAAGINAQSTVVQDVTTSNTLEGLVDIVEQFIVPGDYDYTTKSGTRLLTAGDTVRLGTTYHACPDGLCGDGGAVYTYLGADLPINLGTTDYGDPLAWYKLTGGITDPENWYPGIGNFTDSDARAVGILIVMNDVRSGVEAHIVNADVHAASVSVTALENALLQAEGLLTVSASGGSFYGSGTVLAVGGQIATNLVLGEAHAYIAASTVHVAGDVTVTAKNTSGVDATILSSTSSGGKAVGVTLAFNSLGWKSQNVLFNAVDALLGDPLISGALGGQQPAEAVAYILNSSIISDHGGASVLADNAAQLNATLSNAAVSQASALFGATGAAVGFMLASNKVSARAEAYIRHTDGFVTGSGVRQVVDLLPATPVRLHPQYGQANATAGTATTPVTASHGLTVLLAEHYGAADFTAAGAGSQSVPLPHGTNVTLGAGYGSSDLTAATSGASQNVALQPGDRVTLSPSYGVVGRYASGSGVVDLATGDAVVVSEGYAGGGKPGRVYTWLGVPTADVNLGIQDYAITTNWLRGYAGATYESGSGTRSVAAGDTVLVSEGYAGGEVGAVYRWTGATTTLGLSSQNYATGAWTRLGGVPGGTYQYTGTPATVDLNAQNYASGPWVKVGGQPGRTYRYVGLDGAARDLNAQDYTDTRLWTPIGGTPGATYRYIGPLVSKSGQVLVPVELDLNRQDYGNAALWAKIGGTPNATYQFVGDALTGGGIDLNAQDYTDTRLWAPATTSTKNRVVVDVAGVVVVEAKDSTAIWADVTVVTSSTTFNTGGMNVAQQELNNLIPADYLTSEGTRSLGFGDRVRIANDFIAEDCSSDAGLTRLDNGNQVRVAAGYADPVFTSKSGKRLLMTGETVQLADDFTGSGEPGSVYRYRGPNARLDLGAANYADPTTWALVAGESDSVYQFLGDDDTTLDLGLVDYTDPDLWLPMGGVPGSVYQWMGTDATTVDLSAPLHPYTDLGWWKLVLLAQLIPQGLDFDKSDAYAVGGLVVMNDVRSGAVASIDTANVTAASVTVRALEQAFLRAVSDASIISSGGGSFASSSGDSIAVGGVIATNIVLSEARATIVDSTVTTDADVLVEARNLSQLDARTANLTQSAGKTVGVTLAFNSIGWKSQNILFNAVDAILGDPLISDAFGNQDPALVEGRITDSTVDAGGDVSVIGVNEAVINAESTNDTSMICIMVTGSSGWSVGLLIAKNMVNVKTSATNEQTGPTRGTLKAGGAVTVSTEEAAEIYADTFMRQLTQVINDFGLSAYAGLISAALQDYAYTTNSGTRKLYHGDLVRVADGSVYTWLGADGASRNLGTEDYSSTSWLKVYLDEALTFMSTYSAYWGGFLSGGVDGQGVGLVFVSNDVRGGVRSEITNLTVTGPAGVSVTALETATIRANDLSSVVVEATSGWALNIMAATNLVLSGAAASVTNSALTAASGGVLVSAQNTSTITAEITSRTQAANTGVGITIAFNSIGWDSQNILFNFADALLGLGIGEENPATSAATVTGSTVSAADGIAIKAETAAAITSHVKSSVLTVAVTTLPKPPEPPKTDEEKKPADKPADTPEKPPEPSALKSIAVGAVIAMNKVSTVTQALLTDGPSIVAGGDVTVAAADSATITSTVSAPAIAVSVNLGTNPSQDKGAVAVTVALSVSRNDIRTATEAAITNVPLVRSGGSVRVTAAESSAIDATSTASAIALSASVSGGATSFSGGGATAVNLIAGHTIANVANSQVTAGWGATTGSIEITTTNSSTITAVIAAISAALALAPDGSQKAVAIGVSIARNLIGWAEWGGADPIAVKAQAVNADLRAATGITVSASSTSVIDAFVLAASVAI
ncbi:MAG: hypothetical protein WCF12_16525, partial [Propionicimonas sp.]